MADSGGVRAYAEVLVKAGRVAEAITVLAPHMADERIPPPLVEMTEGQGEDERLLALMVPLAQEARRGRDWLRERIAATDHPGDGHVLLMGLPAGQDRIDEAVEVVRPTFENPWDGLLHSAVHTLADHGLHERARDSWPGAARSSSKSRTGCRRLHSLPPLTDSGRA